MNIHFDEQDVKDACCVFVSRKRGVNPESVEVDLQFEPEIGRFSADARIDRGFISGSEIRLFKQD